jgi:hypothetical protein
MTTITNILSLRRSGELAADSIKGPRETQITNYDVTWAVDTTNAILGLKSFLANEYILLLHIAMAHELIVHVGQPWEKDSK